MESSSPVLPRARTSELLSRELLDGVMVYDAQRHHAHSLNPAAALIWRRCDGKTSVPELARLLQAELGLPADEELVWLALSRLEKAHLMEERLPRSPDAASLSRRALIRKLGLTGGLALLLPVVTSVVAPTPAHAQSGGTTTGGTTTGGTTGGTTTGTTGGAPVTCCCWTATGKPDVIICDPSGVCSQSPGAGYTLTSRITEPSCDQCPDH